MRHLILVGILGLAVPAFAADDALPGADPATKTARPEEAPPMPADSAAPTTGDTAPKAEPDVAETLPEPPPVSPDAVARGTFTTAVDQREPVDSIESLGSDRDRVYYFTEFVGIDGRRLTHRWEYEGEVVAEVPIAIGGPRWRAYSSKELDESRLGEWKVSVVDEAGRVVHTDQLVYEQATPAPELAAPTTKPTETDAPTGAEPATTAAMPEETGTSPAAPAPGAAPEAAPEAD